MFSLRSLVKGTRCAVKCRRHVSGVSKSLVDLKVDNEGVGVLTMQRAPVNSFNVELITEMANAMDEAERSKFKGIVLTSALPTIFSAGMDINEMIQPDVKRLEELWKAMRRVSSHFLTSSCVTTTAITGHTLAAGCIFSIITEYRVMVDGPSIISLNETDLNIIAPTWIVEAMVHVMGRRQAEVALTASTKFTPQEALTTGLIDDIATNKDDAIEKCKDFIRRFDKVVPIARKKTKVSIRKSIIDLWEEEYKPESLHGYIKDVTSPEKQKSLEIYLQVMKNNKNKKM